MGFRIGAILFVILSLVGLGETSLLPHNAFSIGAISGAENEMAMESSVARGLLEAATQNKRHISYDALKKDEVPCSRKGQSYYNCTKMKNANPYKRGCSVITHCKRYTG